VEQIVDLSIIEEKERTYFTVIETRRFQRFAILSEVARGIYECVNYNEEPKKR
jgi:hypothetical protein